MSRPRASIPPAQSAAAVEISRVRFRSDLVVIGTFDAEVAHPHFAQAGQIEVPTFVFPKSSVWIEHEHEPAFVSDPNTVNFYNFRPFVRHPLSPDGDHCHWFELQGSLAREVVASFRPESAEASEGPFPFTHGPSDRDAYRLQQQVLDHLLRTSAPDRLYVEEAVVRMLARVVGNAFAHVSRGRESRRDRRHAMLAEDARAILASRFAESLSLTDIAHHIGSSVFHLCRVFKQHTGGTLHAYRNELRLRSAVAHLSDAADLTTLSLDLGYCSHSHFTAAFSRAFGCTPSAARRHDSPAARRELLARLAVRPLARA